MAETENRKPEEVTSQPLSVGTDPESLLRRIGWHPSDLVQMRVYAQMPPARKISQMLRLRGRQIRLLKARLKEEHPDCSETELSHLLQKHLDLVRETRRWMTRQTNFSITSMELEVCNMTTKEMIKAEIDRLSDDDLDALYELVKNFALSRPTVRSQSILTRLQEIQFDGPEDLAANHDLYASGEKREE